MVLASQLMRAGLERIAVKTGLPLIAFERRWYGFVWACAWLVLVSCCHPRQQLLAADPASSRETEQDAVRRLPLQQLNRESRELVSNVVDNPSFFRRMPSTAIDCDPEMYQHLVRHPEVLVNIWDVMGITKVEAKRTGPYTFSADDGVGTVCQCNLVYGNETVHIYYGSGYYKGSMAPRQINGRCVCVLYNNNSFTNSGEPIMRGSMDVFLKLDNLGADILTRTLGPLVGKTADNNFTESAKFLAQVSQVCEYNPAAAQALASRLHKVQPEVREEFARIAARIGQRAFERQELMLGKLSPEAEYSSPTGSISDSELDLNASSSTASLKFTDVPPAAPAHTASGLAAQPRKPIAGNPGSQPPVSSRVATEGKQPAKRTPLAPNKPNVFMRR